jgi:LPXTG-motif cell wall-anchored protein
VAGVTQAVELPRTGSNPLPVVLVALVLLLGGLTVRFGAKMRRA